MLLPEITSLDGAKNPRCTEEGMSYTQVAAGDNHTVLLRSVGNAVVWGENGNNATFHLWLLEHAGTSYIQVSAGSIQCFSVMAELLFLP